MENEFGGLLIERAIMVNQLCATYIDPVVKLLLTAKKLILIEAPARRDYMFIIAFPWGCVTMWSL